MKGHQITITDIAMQLGISKSTVSRAFKGHPDVNAETKKKVLQLAKETGYSPNMLALHLKKSRNNIIGVLVPDIERPFYASLISGIQQQANKQNLFVLICQSKDSYVAELNIMQTLMQLRVSGILFCHSKETMQFAHIGGILKKEMPLVVIDRTIAGHKIHNVTTDHFSGGYMMGEHLAQQGYKRVAVIGGPASLQMSNLRIEGCMSALKNAGRPVPKKHIAYCNFQRERELAAATAMLDSNTPPDAFFCVHDRAGVELIHFFQQRGVKIPKELGIAGFGNEPMTSYIQPGLTTIIQHPIRIGELAAEILIQEINSDTPIPLHEQIINPELIIRESTYCNR